MSLWEFLVIIGIGFVILELFTPGMFFLNFAAAALITALVSLFTTKMLTLVLVFFIMSFLSFAFLRPLLLKKLSKETETGVNDKYIGKNAKVIEEVNSEKGVISIYGERWEARSENGDIIPQDCMAQIVRNDSLIMYIKKNN